jgi:ribonuclease BN (tRNA processing enzyme)
MVSFIREADILVHDAQYTRAEIKSKLGWGHSTNLDAVEFAAEGRVGSLYLFHHDPSRKDADVTLMMENARSHAASIGSALKVNACIEGEEITI